MLDLCSDPVPLVSFKACVPGERCFLRTNPTLQEPVPSRAETRSTDTHLAWSDGDAHSHAGICRVSQSSATKGAGGESTETPGFPAPPSQTNIAAASEEKAALPELSLAKARDVSEQRSVGSMLFFPPQPLF